MNVLTQTRKIRGRITDLSPFDPDLEESTEPQAIPEYPDAGRQEDDSESGAGAAYGCVEWFHYPRRIRPVRCPGGS